MPGLLDDKIAIITGAASGIGRQAALIFAREGATVVLADVDESGGAETVRQVQDAGGAASFHRADVSRRTDVEALVAGALADHGQLDCAFNNAGIGGIMAPLTDYPEEEWDRVFAINVKGTWFCLQEEIRAMSGNGGGAIVNASSGAGAAGVPALGAYVASKHAVLGLTRTAALECATQAIRVNAVLPGIVDTGMPRSLSGNRPEIMDAFRQSMPIGRLAQPQEIAEAAAWLCSDRASFVTGHGMAVDGGYLTQ